MRGYVDLHTTHYLHIGFDCGLSSDEIEDRTGEIRRMVMTMDYGNRLSPLVMISNGQKDKYIFKIINGNNPFRDFIKSQTLKVLDGLPYETKVKILDSGQTKEVLN